MTRVDWVSKIAPHTFGVEVGVLEGEFAQVILNQQPSKLLLVDAWLHFESGYVDPANSIQTEQDARFLRVTKRFAADSRVTICRALSRAPELIPALSEHPDWVYIDANHAEEECYQDLCFYSQFTTTLAAHDYLPEDNPLGFGVKQAVARFLAQADWRIDLITEEDWPTVVLRRR